MRENHDISNLLRHMDDDEPRPSQRVRLDAPRGQSIDVIEEIRRRPLPREDGYMDTLEERRDAYKRPFSREYLQEELERMMALEKNPYYQFIQLVAGYCDGGILDMMDHQDLARLLREQQVRTQTARRELERSVVPLRDKELALKNARSKRITLNANLRRLRSQEDLYRLLETGDQLVEHAFLPVLVQRTRLAHPDEAVLDESEDAGTERQVTELRDIAAKEGVTYESLIAAGRRRRLFFDLVLGDAVDNSIAHLELLGATVDRLELPDQVPHAKREAGVKKDEESTTTAITTTPTLSTSTTHLADPSPVVTAFGPGAMRDMVLKGVSITYSGWRSASTQKPYADWAFAYITENDPVKQQQLGGEYNIFGSGGPDGQPPEVAKLIRQATGGATNAEALILARQTMARHFIWLYIHNRSLHGMALDAHNMGDNAKPAIAQELTRVKTRLDDAITAAYPALTSYFARVLGFLASQQLLRIDDSQNQALVRLPGRVAALGIEATAEEQARAMRQSPAHTDWILDGMFSIYYQTGKTEYETTVVEDETLLVPLNWLRDDVPAQALQEYPQLALYSLLRGYGQYARIYARHLDRRLLELNKTVEALERQIDAISRETNSLDGEQRRPAEYVQTRAFTALPVNSGIIKLAPFLVSALDRAYKAVQRYCKGLLGLREQDVYAEESHRAGLAGEFAYYVAMLIAENRLVHVRQYNTQHQQSRTLMASDDALQALKRYTLAGGRSGFALITPETPRQYGALSALDYSALINTVMY